LVFHFSIFIAHLIFWFSFLSIAAFGDEIRVNNGDRITGKVTKVTSSNIMISTEYAGNISVSFASIEKISSGAVFHLNARKIPGLSNYACLIRHPPNNTQVLFVI
jgi:hypothetical protein